MPAKQKLLVIDGNALIHRSFHALPPLTAPDGRVVNAVYGFAATLLKAWKDIKPTHIAATFDLKGPTFRHKAFAAYKATRVKAPDELYEQIPVVKDLVRSFNIPVYEMSGYEADDVIGTITSHDGTFESIILTGDMDTMQLVNSRTSVYTIRKGLSDTAMYNEAAVKERYGLTPDQVIDYKALRGDPSDNIPGVKGIGEKTAVDLLQKFGTLEKLYTALADNSKKVQTIKDGVKEKLLTYKSDAFLSKQLATIDCQAPIAFDLEATAVHHYNRDQVVSLFRELGFKSLLSKLPEDAANTPAKKKQASIDLNQPFIPKSNGATYTLVHTPEAFKTFLAELKKQKVFAIDTETTDLNPWTSKLLGLSFSWRAEHGWYVVAKPEFLKDLKPILADPKVAKIGHNMKFDLEVLRLNKIDVEPLSFDTMLASYLLNPGGRAHGLDALVFAELGYEMMPISSLIGPKGKGQVSMDDVPLDKLSWYSSEDADFTWRLYELLKPRLDPKTFELFRDMEMPLINVLAGMELTGVKVDVEFLQAMSKRVKADLEKIEKKIFALAGEPFNINSPLQLKGVLFERLKISSDGVGRTKTGVSTAAGELEKLKDAHPIIPLISQYREISKLISTYLDALPESVNPKTGRVHTSYNQAVAATGRLASSDPNLQNIPIRTELGAEIRKAFIADRGHRLISADYSQIELRIIASMANDEAMIESFRKGEDIHARTAANVHNIPLDQVTPAMRRAAKATNFGILYGQGYVGLSQSAGISREEAKEFIRKYFEVHHRIKAWLDQTKKIAHEQGYVETLFGRKRYFPEINSSNGMLIAQAERMAINAPIQGTAADIMKLAMIKVHADLHECCPEAELLLQVHDELVVEAPEKDAATVSKFLQDSMENVTKLNVPIKVEVGVGKNWGESK